MSGKAQPMITPERATKLLEEVIYERVLGFVDFVGLCTFEHELWFALEECGVPDDAIVAEARALIDRALVRVAGDARRDAPPASFGIAMGANPFGPDCPDCIADARAPRRRS